ncbi:MAG: hypothetical protein RL417_263 [Pseudomonadota bacterium]|jgi:hypothetical protein
MYDDRSQERVAPHHDPARGPGHDEAPALEGDLFDRSDRSRTGRSKLAPAAQEFVDKHEIFSPDSRMVALDLKGMTHLQFIERAERILGRPLIDGNVRQSIQREALKGVESEAETASMPKPDGLIKRFFKGISGWLPLSGSQEDVLKLEDDMSSGRGKSAGSSSNPAPPRAVAPPEGKFLVDGCADGSRFSTVAGRRQGGFTDVSISDAVAAHVAYRVLNSNYSKDLAAVDLFASCAVQSGSKYLSLNWDSGMVSFFNPGTNPDKGKASQAGVIAGMVKVP